jgi:hypothetical protein
MLSIDGQLFTFFRVERKKNVQQLVIVEFHLLAMTINICISGRWHPNFARDMGQLILDFSFLL